MRETSRRDNKELFKVKSGNSKNGVDLVIFALVIILVTIGVSMIYSASYVQSSLKYGDAEYYLKKSLFFAVLGFVVMIFMTNFNYKLLKSSIIRGAMLIGTLALFGMLHTKFGIERNGSLRWVNFFNITTVQPSEVAKITCIVIVAYLISQRDRLIRGFNKNALTNMCIIMAIPVVFMLLIAIQPAMTTAVILGFICVYMLFIAGMDKRFIFLTIILGIVAGILMILIEPYRLQRIMMTFDPFADPTNKTFQALQSVFAISTGGLKGLGIGASKQKYLYLPEAQNDFIFAIIAEELGFIGCIILITLFVMLILRCLKVANNAQDKYGSLLVSGITAHIAIQFLLNLMVALSIWPNTGVGLPFISYGGSSLIIIMAEMGIVLNVSKHEKKSSERRNPII